MLNLLAPDKDTPMIQNVKSLTLEIQNQTSNDAFSFSFTMSVCVFPLVYSLLLEFSLSLRSLDAITDHN